MAEKLKPLPVSQATTPWDPTDFWDEDEFEREYAKQERALPKTEKAVESLTAKLASQFVPAHPSVSESGHPEWVHGYWRDMPDLTPVNDQGYPGMRLIGDAVADSYKTRPDVLAYQEAMFGQYPHSGNQGYDNWTNAFNTQTIPIFLKNDNVRETGRMIVEMSQKDPKLRAWLADPENRPWQGTPYTKSGVYHDPSEAEWGLTVNGPLWNSTRVRDQLGIKMPEDPTDANAYYWAAKFQSTWAVSASDSTVESLALQDAANRRFGLDQDLGPLENDLLLGQRNDMHALANSPVTDAFLQVTYERTQAFLAKNHIESLSLYRGMTWRGGERRPTWARNGDHEVSLNPLSSWSGSRTTAQLFADDLKVAASSVLSATVPASRIFSTPFTGPGCRDEYEFIVLGSKGTVTVDAKRGQGFEY